jgi:hypothetical protein
MAVIEIETKKTRQKPPFFLLPERGSNEFHGIWHAFYPFLVLPSAAYSKRKG